MGGNYTIEAVVTDVAGRVTTSSGVSIFVNTPPLANPDIIDISSASSIPVLANDSDADGDTLTVTGNSTAGHGTVSRNGNILSYTVQNGYTGKDSFTYNVSDNHGGSAVGTVTVKIPPSTVPAPPIADISSPTNTTRITSITNIIGTATSAYLDYYILQYRSAEDVSAPWTTFATGSNSVAAGGVLGVFDPTLLRNGSYDLQLIVVDLVGQSEVSFPVTVTVTDNLKIGHFTMSFTDLQIPVSGLPIKLTRSYDSRNGLMGDFGIGWSIDIASVRLQKNMALGENWQGNQSGFTYCLRDNGPHLLTITFPSGEVHRFLAVAKLIGAASSCAPAFGGSGQYVRFDFVPLPGSFGQLTAPALNDLVIDPIEGSYNGPITINEDSGDLEDVFGPIYDATSFTYTARDGRRFEFNADGRVVKMTDLAGNTLTFGRDGITHSSGRSVKFIRDERGRIGEIYDPNGLGTDGKPAGPAALIYKYDDRLDNLISVQRLVDRLAQPAVYVRTSLLYTNSHFPHYLTTILDPRGNPGIRNEYDDQGRLKSTLDADGKLITFIHDPTGNREITVDRLGNTNIHVYDVRGNIVTNINALGITQSFAYDEFNHQTNVVLGGMQTNAFKYDVNGFLSETVVGNLITNKLIFDNMGQLLVTIDGRGFGTTNTYGPNGRLIKTTTLLSTNIYSYNTLGDLDSEVEPNGTYTTNRYDEFGNVTNTMVKNSAGTVLRSSWFTYDANGNKTSQTAWRTLSTGAKETNTTRYTYDAQDRLIESIDAYNRTNSVVYNEVGQQKATVDPLGRVTRYEYDNQGRLFQITFPDNTFQQSFYDAEGRLGSQLGRAGQTTSYSYDAAGRLIQTIFPDGTTNTTVYNALGAIVYTIDARGTTNAFGYDSAGRRTAVTNAYGVPNVQAVYRYFYDESGNLTNVLDALGRGTTNVYDGSRRLVEVRHPNGTTNFTRYNDAGRIYEEVDPAGVITRFGYDSFGRLLAITNAFGTTDQAVTSFTYDELGNKMTQTDAENHTTRYEYDALGRRIRRQLPLGMAETLQYDAVGNLTNRLNFKNKNTRFQYDVMNRLTNKVPDPSLSEPSIQFTYYASGQRRTMVDASGTTTNIYDIMGRLQQKISPEGTLQYLYDGNGNLTNLASMTAGGASSGYTYDELNRLKTVIDSRSGMTAYGYDLVGNLISLRYPNAITNTYKYGPTYFLQTLSISNSSGRLYQYDYLVDQTTRRTNIVESNGRQVGYIFDKLYRLRQETIQNSSFGPNGTVSYLYDKAGNRTNRTSSSGLLSALPNQSFQYDANDRSNTDTYDDNGNTLQSSLNNPSAGVQGIDEYNFEDRLVRRAGTTATNQIVYNGDGHKVRETLIQGGQTRIVYYLVDELNPTGHAQVLEEWVSVNAAPKQLNRVYNFGHTLLSQVFPAGVLPNLQRSRYYLHDGHGSVAFLADETALLIDAYRYDAFGQLLEAQVRNPTTGVMEAVTGANAQYQTPNTYRYVGEQFDDALGLYYLRARLMNPLTGRMWSADTFEGAAGEPMSLHRYLYANADPVNRVDPSGHESLVGVSIASTIGASIDAMYNGVVSAIGEAMQAAIFGAEAGKSVNDVVIGFVLDQTGISTVIAMADFVQDIFGGGGYDPESAELMAYQVWQEEVLLTFAYTLPDNEGGDFEFEFFPEFEPQCFVAGTPVGTKDGTTPIEEVKTGDMVWALDEQSGQVGLQRVSNRFAHKRDEVVEIRAGGDILQATVEHPFFTKDRGWVSAGNLEAGDALEAEDGTAIQVDSVQRLHGEFVVYNLEIETAHTYFVGANGVLVHNASAAVLAKKLGILKKPLLVAHHIVSRYERRFKSAIEARKILRDVGIRNLDNVINGVALPRNVEAARKLKRLKGFEDLKNAAIHTHIHTRKYYDALRDELKEAYNAGRNLAEKRRLVEARLEAIGERLKVGNFPYD
jgi:RHS repeat-associated protein